ncbi:MAG: hypothetical protein IPP82_01640 [Xanthomonadales bacterium]|nr:hypothetical protein [Xanthomonadales bacterium]
MRSGSTGRKFNLGVMLLGLGLTIAWVGAAAMGPGEGDVKRADSDSGEDAQAGPAAQRLRSELRLLLLDLIESGAFGDVPPEQISLDLDMPAQRLATLGVLIDSRSGIKAEAGLVVLGTTPGGLASGLGIRVGDVIMAVNDTTLLALGDAEDGSARAADVLRKQFASLAEGASIRFKLRRADKELVVVGTVRRHWIPAVHLKLGESLAIPSTTTSDVATGPSERCGQINVFDSAPPQEDLHPVTLISIDGKHSAFDGQSSFRVPTGSHVVTVAENVDNRYLGFNSRLRDNQGSTRYKSLTINVKADTTYRLATHIVAEHRNDWHDGAWWEPVVWSESSETCR